MNAHEKSIARAEKSAISLGEVLGPAAAELVMTGGSMFFKISEVGLKQLSAYVKDRTESRYQEFHRHILDGETLSPEEIDRFLKKTFSADDYNSLLLSMLQDEETEKVRFYARFFKALMLNNVHASMKIALLKALKTLTADEIELMRLLYIDNKYLLKKRVDLDLQEYKCRMMLQSLQRFGLIDPPEEIDNIRHGFYSVNDISKYLIEMLYFPDELLPFAINLEAWTEFTAAVICGNGDDVRHTSMEVCEALENLNIACRSVELHLHVDDRLIVGKDIHILLMRKEDNVYGYTRYMPERKQRFIIKVLMDKEGWGQPVDSIPDISARATLAFRDDRTLCTEIEGILSKYLRDNPDKLLRKRI